MFFAKKQKIVLKGIAKHAQGILWTKPLPPSHLSLTSLYYHHHLQPLLFCIRRHLFQLFSITTMTTSLLCLPTILQSMSPQPSPSFAFPQSIDRLIYVAITIFLSHSSHPITSPPTSYEFLFKLI
jgi:hypothetical protein